MKMVDNIKKERYAPGMFDFRYEKSQDIAGIRKVHESAFESRAKRYPAVVVLGYPGYYSRFGFEPSVNYGITSEYDVPPDVFMIKELTPGVMAGVFGIAKYHEAFAGL